MLFRARLSSVRQACVRRRDCQCVMLCPGTVHLGAAGIGSQKNPTKSHGFTLKPSVVGWRWRQADMSNAAAPPWCPLDTREDHLSAMEMEEGVNVASMNDDEIECPLLVDALWHTLTCEPDGCASKTAAAAARALAHSLDKGGTADEAHAAAHAIRSSCDDLKFVRWAYCHFANGGDAAAAVPFKLPATIVGQATDIPYETSVLGQYRIGTALPIPADAAVRLFNCTCHTGASLCLQPVNTGACSPALAFSTSVLSLQQCDGNSAQTVFLESGPDPVEVRKLKLVQAELSTCERELMEVVSHRAYKERGCSGDKELAWDGVNAYLDDLRRKENELRLRIEANSPGSNKTHSRRKGVSSNQVHDELVKEHHAIVPVVLLDSKVCDLRERLYRLSESAGVHRVIAWSRWSPSAAAHTPPEPPLIGERPRAAVRSGAAAAARDCLTLPALQICRSATQ
jgi:hypothetical protein